MASVTRVRRMEKVQDVPEAGGNSRVGLAILWVLAILVFGIGDVFTTAAVLGLGGAEGNTVAAAMMQVAGGNVWVLTLAKGIILSGLLLLSYIKLGKYAWTIPTVLAGTGTYLLLYNMAALKMLL